MINIRNISLFGGLFAIVVIALGAWTRLVDAVSYTHLTLPTR